MGVYDVINKNEVRHIMRMVVLFLLILILLSKTIYRLSFTVFSVVMRWLIKCGRDFKTWKVSSIEQISANGLAVAALAFKIQ